ncbi:MAG: hypothetical protein H0U74_10990 [Bradymonadaceae bacterium]|nr:hypothetical protein [Lujinxingiaceae bacterium]
MNLLTTLSRRALTACAFALLSFLILAAPAVAAPLEGRLTDGLTGTPLASARVHVLGTELEMLTDANGAWAFDLPAGHYELAIEIEIDGELQSSRLVNQYVPQVIAARAHVYTSAFVDMGYPALEHPTGVPTTSGRLPDDGPESLDLDELLPRQHPSLNYYEIPANQPPTIRVGRRQDHTGAKGCTDSTNPIIAIHQMDLDEYVKGVLPPEIGVFRNISGAREVYKAFAIAAKSYGLWFILRYGEGNRRTVSAKPPHNYTWFHIDDTACNQRYDDQRMAITNESADAVARLIMVKKGATTTIDKYEYAASCGKHGSRPAYQTTLVADKPPTSACAGTWCGHNACAAHEVNPAVPNEGRCLVRGICQWGSASWGENAKTYTWLLAHYQPNIVLRELGSTAGAGKVVLTGYVYTDAANIASSGVADVNVALSDGQRTATNAQGVYYFDQVALDLGTVSLTASKTGYLTARRDKQLESGATNWGSIKIELAPVDPVGPVDPADPADPIDPGTPQADTGVAIGDAGNLADVAHGLDDTGDDGVVPITPGTHPRDNSDPNALGRLVSPSHGIDGGCATGAAASSPRLTLVLPLLAFALFGFSRRRRR